MPWWIAGRADRRPTRVARAARVGDRSGASVRPRRRPACCVGQATRRPRRQRSRTSVACTRGRSASRQHDAPSSGQQRARRRRAGHASAARALQPRPMAASRDVAGLAGVGARHSTRRLDVAVHGFRRRARVAATSQLAARRAPVRATAGRADPRRRSDRAACGGRGTCSRDRRHPGLVRPMPGRPHASGRSWSAARRRAGEHRCVETGHDPAWPSRRPRGPAPKVGPVSPRRSRPRPDELGEALDARLRIAHHREALDVVVRDDLTVRRLVHEVQVAVVAPTHVGDELPDRLRATPAPVEPGIAEKWVKAATPAADELPGYRQVGMAPDGHVGTEGGQVRDVSSRCGDAALGRRPRRTLAGLVRSRGEGGRLRRRPGRRRRPAMDIRPRRPATSIVDRTLRRTVRATATGSGTRRGRPVVPPCRYECSCSRATTNSGDGHRWTRRPMEQGGVTPRPMPQHGPAAPRTPQLRTVAMAVAKHRRGMAGGRVYAVQPVHRSRAAAASTWRIAAFDITSRLGNGHAVRLESDGQPRLVDPSHLCRPFTLRRSCPGRTSCGMVDGVTPETGSSASACSSLRTGAPTGRTYEGRSMATTCVIADGMEGEPL